MATGFSGEKIRLKTITRTHTNTSGTTTLYTVPTEVNFATIKLVYVNRVASPNGGSLKLELKATNPLASPATEVLYEMFNQGIATPQTYHFFGKRDPSGPDSNIIYNLKEVEAYYNQFLLATFNSPASFEPITYRIQIEEHIGISGGAI